MVKPTASGRGPRPSAGTTGCPEAGGPARVGDRAARARRGRRGTAGGRYGCGRRRSAGDADARGKRLRGPDALARGRSVPRRDGGVPGRPPRGVDRRRAARRRTDEHGRLRRGDMRDGPGGAERARAGGAGQGAPRRAAHERDGTISATDPWGPMGSDDFHERMTDQLTAGYAAAADAARSAPDPADGPSAETGRGRSGRRPGKRTARRRT